MTGLVYPVSSRQKKAEFARAHQLISEFGATDCSDFLLEIAIRR